MSAIIPKSIHPPFANYAHGVEVPAGGRIIRTSGQLGITANGETPAEAYEQAVICFANIRAVLAEKDMSAANVVHLTAYVTAREHMGGYMKARDEFTSVCEEPPASTLLIVSGFTRPEFLVEVEAMATATVPLVLD